MPRDVETRGEVHYARFKHQLIAGIGLNQHDVDAGVAVFPLAPHLMQALVSQELEGLVADVGETHLRYPLAIFTVRGRLAEVVDVRDERVYDDDELGASLDCDIEVRGRDDAAVDQVAPLDFNRAVDHWQGS